MPVNIKRNVTQETIHHADWDEDEFVYLRPVKSYIFDTRARTRASRIPEGMSWDQIQLLSTAERSKLELFDSGAYQLSLFQDMIVGWTLRFPNKEDGSKGDLLPCTPEYMEMLPDDHGTFIADAIADRSGGRAALAVVKDIDFPESTDTVPVQGELPTPGASSDDENPVGVRGHRKDRVDAGAA